MINISDKRIRFTDQNIEYKKRFKWLSLPYSEIIQAYMRIEEVNSKMCCGTANFDMHFLMLRTQSGEFLKIPVTSRKLTEQMLDYLSKVNLNIEIGYKKNDG